MSAHTKAAAAATSANWDVDEQLLRERSEHRAWTVAKVSWAITAVAVIGIAVQGKLRQEVTIPVLVDRATGEVSISQPLTERTVPINDALDKHHLARYVGAREAYAWRFLQTDYKTVGRMSTPQVFQPYNAQFEGPNRLDERLKDTEERRVKVTAVRLAGEVPGLNGIRQAVVTYDLVTTAIDRPQPQVVRYQATLQYEYRPKLAMKEQDRLDNPLGFVVTAYRTDAEIATVPRAGATS
ncbi:virB8 family protein [Azohydromonas aeria]|uniref:virB8 family protein n=1 Tax=Azohydromonas aeria TaxID=2590212 RepID=UPI0018DFDC99|nr:type IV secretion system protein [Azohydromonas aeria]